MCGAIAEERETRSSLDRVRMVHNVQEVGDQSREGQVENFINSITDFARDQYGIDLNADRALRGDVARMLALGLAATLDAVLPSVATERLQKAIRPGPALAIFAYGILAGLHQQGKLPRGFCI